MWFWWHVQHGRQNIYVHHFGTDFTFIGPQASGSLETLSSWIVFEKAGQGEECSNLDVLQNNSWPHSEHTYTPKKTKVESAARRHAPWSLNFMHLLLLTCFKVIFIFFSTRERAIWHFGHLKFCFLFFVIFLTTSNCCLSLTHWVHRAKHGHPEQAGKILLLECRVH